MSRAIKRCWRIVPALAVAGLLAACMTVGEEFRKEAVELIEPGQTTDKEILKIFGNPVRTGIAEDGSREWTYAYYRAGMGGFEGYDLVLKFDDRGRVKSFSYHTTDPEEEIVKPR